MTEVKDILDMVEKFYQEKMVGASREDTPVSGKTFDAAELKNLVEASLEGWWTEGRWCDAFEKKLKYFLGIKYALTVNSGSSANLIAMSSLTSKKLDNRLIAGDEVITAACGFPTTINPILQVGAVPVFVDVEMGTYNPSIEMIKEAVSSKTKAIILAHALGNPFAAKEVKEICEDHKIWLIEDNCDALGSKYDGKYTGTIGDIGTISFYPAHHITTAEGGVVITDNPDIFKAARSMRDWGRDCWCSTGKDNTCSKRFSMQLGKLPMGFDHKYIFSELGYNVKMTDLQAAIGVAQIDKLPDFISRRKENYQYLKGKLADFEDKIVLPKVLPGAEPSWFGFPITIKNGAGISRLEMLKFLTERKIATRLLFAGNILRQPYFVDNGYEYKLSGSLDNSDRVVDDTFWIGTYPGLAEKNLEHIYNSFKEYFSGA